jgi:hypothetical protein
MLDTFSPAFFRMQERRRLTGGSFFWSSRVKDFLQGALQSALAPIFFSLFYFSALLMSETTHFLF